MGYTKLFHEILDSTVWREPPLTKLVWITMLAMADRDGEVMASVPGLADRARVSLDACQVALASFSAPDEFSRTKEREGRRIEEIDGGWRLLNFEKFRLKMGAEERREKTAIRVRRFRERQALQSVTGVTSNAGNPTRPAPAPAPAPDQKQTEIGTDSREPADRSPPFLVFTCAGGSPVWALTEGQATTWEGSFPGIDVRRECRQAQAWLEASPSRKKTAKGMARFLVGWLGRSQNRGGGVARAAGSKTANNLDNIRQWHGGKE